jgi:hypothetical protein
MPSKRDTGEGIEYSGSEAEAMADALAEAFEQWGDYGEPAGFDVSAQVEWAGTVQPSDGGQRRTRIEGLNPADMAKVREAVREYRAAAGQKTQAKPLKSYSAKGWHAQLRALTGTVKGLAAADAAGLSPTVATLRRWLADEEYPIRKSDREKIERAYGSIRDRPVTEARSAASKDASKVATALTNALRERYGVNVRFRDIRRFDLE